MGSTELNVAALVEQLPDSDSPGAESTFTGPEPGEATPLFEQILAAGPAAVTALIELIREPGHPDFRSFRAEYLLHCLAVYVGGPDRTAWKRMLSASLAEQAANTHLSMPVRALLVRELGVAGGPEVVPALIGLLAEADLCEVAVAALCAIGDGAAEPLRGALAGLTGRCRLAAVQALGALAAPTSAGALRDALRDEAAAVRVAAAWALARVGDGGARALMLAEADREEGFDRVKATQACLLLAETLRATGRGQDAAGIYRHLFETRTDPAERHIREIAARALGAG